MKTILVPTDFSKPAENAAHYAFALAKQMRSNIRLFNAFKVPQEAPAAAQVVWPMLDYNDVKEQVTTDLQQLAKILSEAHLTGNAAFETRVESENELGSAIEGIRNSVSKNRLPLVVMGMSGGGNMSKLLLGSTSRQLIEKADFPVLLIPPDHKYHPVKKIAIASDLSKSDIEVVCSLASFARYFNADILITHVTNDKTEEEYQYKIKSFLSEVTSKCNYPGIYYRHVKSIDVDHGLSWLVEHGQVDILAMVHRKHNWWQHLFSGSHTQHLAKHTDKPLLVFPSQELHKSLPVF